MINKIKTLNMVINPKSKEDKFLLEIDSKAYNVVIHDATKIAIDKTLNEMVKCKDIEQMNSLALNKEIQEKLYSKAFENPGRNIIIEKEYMPELVNALSEYKNVLTTEIKKAEEIDELCDKMHYCNILLRQLS